MLYMNLHLTFVITFVITGCQRSLCPFVHLSHASTVTLSKTMRAGIRNYALSVPCRTSRIHEGLPEILNGSTRSRALSERRVGKICDFQPVVHHISERMRDRAKVTAVH